MKTITHFWSYLAQLFSEREIFQTEILENIKTYFVFCNFFFENRAIYEIMWKNILEPNRPQMTIWSMLIVISMRHIVIQHTIICWIAMATNTHSEYVILLFFHCNNGCRNAPQCYVICKLPVLFPSYSVGGLSLPVAVRNRIITWLP